VGVYTTLLVVWLIFREKLKRESINEWFRVHALEIFPHRYSVREGIVGYIWF